MPILCWSPRLRGMHDLGTRATYADTAATISEYLGLLQRFGAVSYLKELEG